MSKYKVVATIDFPGTMAPIKWSFVPGDIIDVYGSMANSNRHSQQFCIEALPSRNETRGIIGMSFAVIIKPIKPGTFGSLKNRRLN